MALAFGIGLLLLGIIDGVCYGLQTPALTPAPKAGEWRRLVAAIPHGAAYGFALLRLPFCLVPYGAKLVLWLVLNERFGLVWHHRWMQGIRLLGDGVNFLLIAYWLMALGAWGELLITAEFLRLVLEKGQMLVSATWQQLPHRALAERFRVCPWTWVRSYCHYYRKTDAARLTYLLRVLRCWSRADGDTAQKLRYVRAFRMVDSTCDLRTGQVRHVALGEIFIHAQWSNDPFLLIGLALRRSPWVFDPRYLRRPFYYRTEANPHATRFVLENAHFSPPFALYQLGHEIKAARFELFYRACGWFGVKLEAPVQADGTYAFDPLLQWFAQRMGRAISPPKPALHTDVDVQAAAKHQPLLVEQIAVEYTYPVLYVEEVLSHAFNNDSATTSGTSQCG